MKDEDLKKLQGYDVKEIAQEIGDLLAAEIPDVFKEEG